MSRPEPASRTLLEQAGGTTGVILSSVPVVAFVIANTLGGLTVAIVAALSVAAVIAVARLVRREPTADDERRWDPAAGRVPTDALDG